MLELVAHQKSDKKILNDDDDTRFYFESKCHYPISMGREKKALLSRGNALIYFFIVGIATLLFCDKAFIYSSVM